MSQTFSLNARRAMVALCSLSAVAGAACAQTGPTPPPATTDKPPNAETPPGGIARGVVPPPKGVDPSMVQPPPANVKPAMPVIKPPGTSR